MGWVTLERTRVAVFFQLKRLDDLMTALTRRKLDLQKYATSIARGFITPAARAGMPASCAALATGFALAQGQVSMKALNKAAMIWGSHYGNASTGLSAAQATEDFGRTVSTMIEDPKGYEAKLGTIADENARNQEYMKHQYMLNLFQKAEEEERREYAKQETDRIKEIENEIDLEIQQYNTRRQALDQQHASLEKAVAAAQKQEAAKYTAQG